MGWVVVAALAVVALLRVFAWDVWEPLAVFNSVTLVLYLPAWVITVGGLLWRRWWLAGAAGLMIAAQVAFLAPEFVATTRLPSWVGKARMIQLVDANVDKDLRLPGTYLDSIRRTGADLLMFEELTPNAARALIRRSELTTYPYHCGIPAYGAVGLLLVSRIRLTDCQIQSDSIKPFPAAYLVKATAWLPAGPIKVRVVHTLAPFPAYWSHWTAQMAALGAMVRHDGPSRMLMVGDFNATWGNRSFRAILEHGLTDAAAARGEATDMTWPNGALVPPFVRIDHVLTGPGLVVMSVHSEAGTGSDHRFLVSTIAVR